MARNKVHRSVSNWLLIGLVMVLFQVGIGGITRLTDSGLSITEWAVIQGTLPPLSENEWIEAFELYKSAAGQQYMSLHADMTIDGFKVIFFWEYFHRLWARIMGVVFLIPCMVFLWKKLLPSWLIRRLVVVIGLGGLAAVFGWIMVASGLNEDNRTWVSAYKLIIHLLIATSLFGYLFWTWLLSLGREPYGDNGDGIHKLAVICSVLVIVQISFGGLMAGMKAGLIHPYFPVFVNGKAFFAALGNMTDLTVDNLVNYEGSQFVKSWVQLLHRGTAYVLTGSVLLLSYRLFKQGRGKQMSFWLSAIVLVQFLLGVITVMLSIGKIPVNFGAAHQVVALILWITVLKTFFISRKPVLHVNNM